MTEHIAVRVKDIILNIEHPQAIELGGYDSIGTIYFTRLDENIPLEKTWTNITNTARPLFSFLKNYPLINEIVLIQSSYDKSIYQIGNTSTNYYLPNLNIWNHPHHNALPTTKEMQDDASKQDYEQTQNGIVVRQVEDGSTDINLGDYFSESLEIKPLLPYEGDTIIEGRFGNSIRFGSTNISEDILPENKNRWSNEGKTGDPITLIRNGQLKNTDKKGWVHIIEDIDDDASSIYLTSNQQLKDFIPASIHQKSFGANLIKPENLNQMLTDPILDIITEPEIEEQEMTNEEEPVMNPPFEPVPESTKVRETVTENVAYYDVAPSENNEIDKDTEVELDEKSVKSINDYNLTPEELDKPLGSFFIEPITSVQDNTDLSGGNAGYGGL